MQIKSLFQSLCLFQRMVLLTDKVAPIMTSGQELAWQFQNCVYREEGHLNLKEHLHLL